MNIVNFPIISILGAEAKDHIDHISHIIFWKDKNSIFLGCNKAFAKEAGLSSPKEIIGRTDYDLPWKEEGKAYREDDNLIISTEKPKLYFEETQTTKQGKEITLLTSKFPLYDDKNKLSGILGIYTDITKTKQTEIEPKIFNKNKLDLKTRKAKKFYLFDDKKTYFTLTEAKCAYFLLKGNTYKEIASHLNSSPRTVEAHIEHMKQKVHCYSKSKLIESILQSNFSDWHCNAPIFDT